MLIFDGDADDLLKKIADAFCVEGWDFRTFEMTAEDFMKNNFEILDLPNMEICCHHADCYFYN